jgi:2-amino-4-hydroxy-6-hydroxymethyldihydropteridine diphosphokinase
VPEALLGLGGNLGDPAAAIEAALARFDAAGVRVTRRSHLYRTAPWGVTDQPDFLNLCAAAETALAPHALLSLAQRIEAELGRTPGARWGPRVIDIDILTYGDAVVDEPDLKIPHPRMTERAFVLVPLAEIAPEAVIRGRSVRAWSAMADRSGIERLAPLTAVPGRTKPKAE